MSEVKNKKKKSSIIQVSIGVLASILAEIRRGHALYSRLFYFST